MPLHSPRRLFRLRHAAVLAALLALIAGGSSAVFAQPSSTTRSGVSDADLARLKERVERRYQILQLRQGIVLVPRFQPKPVDNIEISNGLVLIDGTPVTGRELRGRLPEDADLIVQLSFLDDQARQKLSRPTVVEAPLEPLNPPPAVAPPETPSLPEPPVRDEGPLVVRESRSGARVRIGGDVWVREQETVGDAVVVILGRARIDGHVRGDVVAVGGGVFLGPHAEVGGSVTSVGGSIDRMSGARVGGDVNEVRVTIPPIQPFVHVRPFRAAPWFGWPFSATDQLIATLLRLGLVALVAAMFVVVVPSPVRRVSERVGAEPWRAGFVGLFAQLLFVPILVVTIVILVVSIIGIPLLLLVPVALLVLVLGSLLGFTGAACAVGQSIGRRFGTGGHGLFTGLAIGLAVVFALTVIARFAGLAGTPARVLFGVVLVAGFLIEYVVWTVGLGGVLLSRFGRRETPGFTGVPGPPVPVPPAESDGVASGL